MSGVRQGVRVRRALRHVCQHTVTVVVINPYSAGIDFRRQNLTSTDVRF